MWQPEFFVLCRSPGLQYPWRIYLFVTCGILIHFIFMSFYVILYINLPIITRNFQAIMLYKACAHCVEMITYR